MPRTTVHTVDSLMTLTFYPGRTAHSAAYIAGARAGFDRQLNRTFIRPIGVAGSAEFDAFWAGFDESQAVIRINQV